MPTAPPIRLIAIDLDGTLLSTRKQVSPRNATALRRAQDRGIRIVIASARPPRSVRAIYRLLQLDTLQINYNGALIWDDPAAHAVFHRPLDGSLALRMIEMARRQFDEVIVHCEVLDRWCTDRINDAFTTETGRLFKPDLVTDLPTICRQPITKLMFLGQPRIITQIEAELMLQFSDRVAIVRQEGELLQIMDRRVGKALALRKVARAYDVDMQEVMAIGDATNDVGMLQLAGLAVAMANGHPAARAVADYIAPTNDDDGVHAALVHFGLCD
jgi:Cof subfamily protein (haloacid dehalogenase superfamily)